MKNKVQSLWEDNHWLEWMVQSLVVRMEMIEARMALFQETVGKLSPPRIRVGLMQEEEDGGIGGPIEQPGSIFLGGFISDHNIAISDDLISSSTLISRSCL